MALSAYHQKYADLPDEAIQDRAEEKRQELSLILEQTPLKTASGTARVAVLGCGDKRFVGYHQKIFEAILGKPTEITTFDITTEHLDGEKNIIEYDCTLPLPNGPFDITYAHVLLKFVGTEKQWNLIRNSYEALKPGGLAIHVMDREDYETKGPLLPNGQFAVPLERWKNKLDGLSIRYREVPVKYGLALTVSREK